MRNFITLSLFAIMAGCSQEQVPPPTPAPAGAAASAPTQPETSPNEGAAIAGLKALTRAQTEYFQRNRRYALDYDELIAGRFLTDEPSTAKTGYVFRMRPAADAASYTITAVPNTPAPTARHLFSDQTAEIHAEFDKEATLASPKI